jgi:hypothetical protein
MHRVAFRKRRGFPDVVRRTAWFVRTSARDAVLFVLTVTGLVLSVASLFSSSGAWLVVGVAALGIAGITFVVDWRGKVNDAESLCLMPVPPVDRVFAPPYDTWQHARLPNGAPGLVYDADLDADLARDATIRLRRDGSWLPAGEARGIRRLLGGLHGQFVERKIRLADDLVPGCAELAIQKTDYVSYIVTNGLADKEVCRSRGAAPVLTFDDVERLDAPPGIPPLELSRCSNHLGGDLLLVGHGVLWLQIQNHHNLVHPDALSLSSSGSFDWYLDLDTSPDLVTVVKRGMLRELAEELNLAPSGIPVHADVRVVRYGRAAYMGGKPQFLAVARSTLKDLPTRRGKGDKFTKSVVAVNFDPNLRLPAVIAALDATRSKHLSVSRPYLMLLDALRDISARDGGELDAWMFR